jgi:alpha-beta hydrolase superfamily lysophospholipase
MNQPFLPEVKHQIHRSTFLSEGVSCSATLRVPAFAGAPNPMPAILMVHGWGGTQMSMLPPFYERFMALGFAVMTFDYRGWGQSAGTPRHVISVADRLQDVHAALHHLKTQPMIDTDGIVLWGTSLGGGHVCSVATWEHNLLGVIAQVPMLDGRAAARATPLPLKLKFAAWALFDLIQSKILNGQPYYIPITSKPDEKGTMSRDGAYLARERSESLYGKHSANLIAARSLLTMGNYRPIKHLHNIFTKTLLIGGKGDTVAPFNKSAVTNFQNENISVVEIEADHFQPYFPPMLNHNLDLQSAFLTARYNDWLKRCRKKQSSIQPMVA